MRPNHSLKLRTYKIFIIQEYRLNTSTLFFAVHLIDHLILKFEVKKYQFQLLGSAALLLAAKMEEVEVRSEFRIIGSTLYVSFVFPLPSSLASDFA